MRIKKHSNGSKYLLTPQNRWVRDFTRKTAYFDLNNTISEKDYFLFLKNEMQNAALRPQWIDSEKLGHEKIVIVSDGYNFDEKHKILANLPKDVTIMGVNGSLTKWNIPNRSLNYYIVNNPYDECLKYLPRRQRILPKCIASSRTNSDFLANYYGTRYRYYPVNESAYVALGSKDVQWQIDDYRNAVCAAIGLAYHFGADKLLLLCCDDVFENERAGAIQLENKLWMYPQHEIAHGLIDGSLYWFKNQPHREIIIGNCSSGPIYENATYINEHEIVSFFGNGKL